MSICVRGFSPRLITNYTSFMLSRANFMTQEKSLTGSGNTLDFSQQNRSPSNCIGNVNEIIKPKSFYEPLDNRELSSDVVTKENVYKLYKTTISVSNRSEEQSYIRPSEDIPPPPSGKASEEQLHYIHAKLSHDLPRFFVETMDYKIYHPELVFENNIKGVTTVGLPQYIKTLSFLRIVGHLRFAYVSFDILKITKHEEDSSVKVRWRIKGISALGVIRNIWNFRLWNVKEMYDKTEAWYDGFSIFYVNNNGQIVKHIADKMMPDSSTVTDDGPPMAAKLALLTGLYPKVAGLIS